MCLSAEAAKMQDKCKFQKRWTNRRQHDVHAALSLILVEDKTEKGGLLGSDKPARIPGVSRRVTVFSTSAGVWEASNLIFLELRCDK